MRRILFIPFFLALLGCRGTDLLKLRLEMSGADLFNSFRAENVYLNQTGELVLDLRKARGEARGLVETDIIDLLDPQNNSIAPGSGIQSIELTCWASAPQGGKVELYTRCGDSFFDQQGWSAWQKAPELLATIERPAGRYIQARVELAADDQLNSPRISGLDLCGIFTQAASEGRDSVSVALFDNPVIVRSPVEFACERMDQQAVREFARRNRLAGMVAECKSEMDTLVTVLHWVARIRNTRHHSFAGLDYPWDVGEIVSYDPEGAPSIEGHCMSYAVTYITALTGLGFTARHWADQGFRFADHEVVEAWSNSLGKWVYFDPSLDHYYTDSATGEPLSILELHRVFTDTFFKDGETLRMPMDRQRERLKAAGGRNVPIEYVSGHYAYGRPNPDYDWGWFHGYLACGFMRLTTRNDFHSRKEPWFAHFGEGVHDFDRFLSWSDQKTPVSDKITRFSERERDFYWTLNQAQIKARRAGPRVLELEFGQSMPYFKDFLLSVDGAAPVSSASTYLWQLNQGENRLAVVPRNEWGRTGVAARLNVSLKQAEN